MTSRGRLIGVIAFVLMAYASAATIYARTWQSDVSLWARAVQVAPFKIRPRVNYAVALARAGQPAAGDLQMAQVPRLMTMGGTSIVDRTDGAYAFVRWQQLHPTSTTPIAMPGGFIYEDRNAAELMAFAPSFSTPRSLTVLTLWLQHRAGEDLRVFRFFNLLLHACVVAAFALLLHRLSPKSPLAVFAGAAFLAVHPLTIETLMTLSGRGELIAALAVVLATVAALSLRGWRLVLAYTLCLLAGYHGKESAVVVLAAAPAAYACYRMSSRALWTAIAGTVAIVSLAVWQSHRGESVITADVFDWLGVQAAAAVRLCTMAVLPIGQTVDFDYDHVPVAVRMIALVVLVMAAVLTGILARGRALAVALGASWTLLVILPRLIVRTPRSYFNEHQFYLALVGVGVIVAAIVNACDQWTAAGAVPTARE